MARSRAGCPGPPGPGGDPRAAPSLGEGALEISPPKSPKRGSLHAPRGGLCLAETYGCGGSRTGRPRGELAAGSGTSGARGAPPTARRRHRRGAAAAGEAVEPPAPSSPGDLCSALPEADGFPRSRARAPAAPAEPWGSEGLGSGLGGRRAPEPTVLLHISQGASSTHTAPFVCERANPQLAETEAGPPIRGLATGGWADGAAQQ